MNKFSSECALLVIKKPQLFDKNIDYEGWEMCHK